MKKLSSNLYRTAIKTSTLHHPVSCITTIPQTTTRITNQANISSLHLQQQHQHHHPNSTLDISQNKFFSSPQSTARSPVFHYYTFNSSSKISSNFNYKTPSSRITTKPLAVPSSLHSSYVRSSTYLRIHSIIDLQYTNTHPVSTPSKKPGVPRLTLPHLIYSRVSIHTYVRTLKN